MVSRETTQLLMQFRSLWADPMRAPTPSRTQREAAARFMVRASSGDPTKDEEAVRVARILAGEDADAANMPPYFSNVHIFRTVQQLQNDIQAAAVEAHLPLASPPVLAAMYTSQMNVRTYDSPDGHVIIIDDRFFTFALLLSKCVALSLPRTVSVNRNLLETDAQKIRRSISANAEAIERFSDLLFAHLVLGEVRKARPYRLSGTVEEVAQILLDGMELFVVSHEYGHVSRQHKAHKIAPVRFSARRVEPLVFDHEEIEQRLAMRGSSALGLLSYSWEQEGEADIIGIGLAIGAMLRRGHTFAQSIAGASAYLTAMDVVSRATTLLAQGVERQTVNTSHPPPLVRLRAIREAYPSMLDSPNLDREVAAAHQLGEVVEVIVDELWENIRPWVLEAHERGLRPATSE